MSTTRGRGGRGRNVSKELAPDLNTYDRAKVMTIWRRIEFLEKRIEQNPDHNTRDKSEVSALRWLLEKAALPAPELQV